MLNVQDLDYVRSLINTYKKQGYNYYLLTTNSDSSVNADIYLFLSKEKIEALDDVSFSIKNGIRINIDTSYRYNEHPDVLSMRNEIVNNVYIIDKYEFVYTNCVYNYKATQSIIYPDILLSGADSYDGIYVISFLLIIIFLYMFFKSILRVRR